ncbi:MAG TPA: substrate-binding domain-containing protein [Nitrospira sp.]|nr:substrate-binding domain-containing protein [Nitrospira sp.]
MRMVNHGQCSKRNQTVRYLLAGSGILLGLLAAPFGTFAFTGRIVIAGYGPEQPIIQDLAQAYEKLHPGTAIDIEWDKTVRAVEMVKAGDAQIAVTDREVPSLDAVPIAWDGIAVIVNFSNPLSELTSDQIRGLFTGQVQRWSSFDGADRPVEVVTRSGNDNLTAGFEASLGITGKLTQSTTTARSDQQALRLVSGRDAAVSYMSLRSALRAQEDGIPIRILTIDHVEAGEPTVASGRYPWKRPVLLLTRKQTDPLTASFVSFARSTAGQPLVRSLYTPLGSFSAITSPSPEPSSDSSRPKT